MKTLAMWLIVLLIPIATADLLSAYFLFFSYGTEGNPTSSQGITFPSEFLLNKALIKVGVFDSHCPYSKPAPFFRKDDKLGWSVAPGAYHVFFCVRRDDGALPFRWNVTITDDINRRATSFAKVVGKEQHLYIFGDSVVFGWGVNDENTLGWHLQDALRDDWEVYLLANAGYSNVHNLLQFRALEKQIIADDVLIFGYGYYYNPRNVAAPSRFAAMASSRLHNALQTEIPAHPKAELVNGQIKIEYLPLDCSVVSGYCNAADPSAAAMVDVTRYIFMEILQHTKAKVAILFLEGADDDPVISFLKERGADIIDVRTGRYPYLSKDGVAYDGHPGPVAHYVWYKEIMKYLDKLR